MTTEPTIGTTPVACTLTSADLAAQSERWKQLAASALIDRVETERGLRISFLAAPGVEEELRALVVVENECCAWADWTVETTAEAATLDVRSTGEGIAALHGMFTSLRRQPR
jgi:hypothetical protein